MILGIDESGKGPVIGSMFVVGICANEKEILYLKKLGIKDSKKLSAKRRNILYEKIINNISGYYILEVKANIIDELRTVMTMNEIIVNSFSSIIYNLSSYCPNTIIVDAADVSETRFKKNLLYKLNQNHLNFDISKSIIISKHKADSKFLIVATASIIAKVERDKMINNLKKSFNLDIGSGYPSDSKTINFLKYYIKKNRYCDNNYSFIRTSWNTYIKLKDSYE